MATAGLLAVAALSGGLYVSFNEARVTQAYQSQRLLDHTEVAAMRWLATQPGVNGKVMNDPNDGSPYMWALDGLHPVFGHIVGPGTAPGKLQRLLLDHFNCLDGRPEIRRAVRDLDIRYVFTSAGYVRTEMSQVEGLLGLNTVRSLTPELPRRRGADLPGLADPAGHHCPVTGMHAARASVSRRRGRSAV